MQEKEYENAMRCLEATRVADKGQKANSLVNVQEALTAKGMTKNATSQEDGREAASTGMKHNTNSQKLHTSIPRMTLVSHFLFSVQMIVIP